MDTATIWFIILGGLLITALIGWGLEKDTNIPTKRIDW